MNPSLLKHLLTSNPALKVYFYYVGVLALKMMLMFPLTLRQRIKNNAFISEEDAVMLKGKVSRTNENVERVRRAHLNDMEGIYLFMIVSFAWIWTEPDPQLANLLFLTFTICRFIHTFVYAVYVVPQPARGIVWFVGYAITGYMAVKTITTFGRS